MLKLIDKPDKPSVLSCVKAYIKSPKPIVSSQYGRCYMEDDYDDEQCGYSGEYSNLFSSLSDGYIDGDDGDDFYPTRLPPVSVPKSHKVTRRGGHKRSLSPSRSDKYWKRTQGILHSYGNNYNDDTIRYSDSDSKMIYYYRDPSIKSDVEEFTSLYEFGEFLDSEGINISSSELSDLSYRTVSHCAINPYDKATSGALNLISDHSYGALFYNCCETCD